jgi:hypothetical protein
MDYTRVTVSTGCNDWAELADYGKWIKSGAA